MSNKNELQTLVNGFVDQLHGLWKKQAIAALGGDTNGYNGHTTNGHSLGRGAKRPPAQLEQIAADFAAFVAKKPGLRIEQINKELGTTTKQLALPIRKLLAEKRVKTKGEKRSTTYYPGKSDA